MTPAEKFPLAWARLPLVAILRGMRPDEAMALGATLTQAGWPLIEVPLNSPDALKSISRLAGAYPQALIGAGTVLRLEQVDAVFRAGGQMIVAPNFNADVVRAALRLGMICLPGVMTATEALAALDAGAHGLKLFPAEMIAPAAVKALRAVLPPRTLLLPVGGIVPGAMAAYRAAGANGFGIGSALYQPGMNAAEVGAAAQGFIASWTGTMRA